ncbi:MAG TPA: glycine cleavage system aminomethyltransferase GcvT [candidate division WOR-3 bacterium]|uniref:Aminomethyltransferase n=1 Tax=candidate division WOR-3 bacterium TaxID=2052148 RepID=A0A7V0XF46_UNCW3|nr:glycine cleavage system aminomethyltransferase GcvT [candidate division WOR-3 bacterium]
MAKKTPFYDKHVAAGGKMVEFAGYELPVQFRGIIPEHRRVRSTVGVFDVSHMGRLEVSDGEAEPWLNHLTTNDVTALATNQAQYSVLCYPDGGIIDDLVVYRLADRFLLVVNGANSTRDFAWLRQHASPGVKLENVTEETAQLAVQGPKAEAVLARLSSVDLSAIAFYWSLEGEIAGVPALISRTGYTGEDGFELYFARENAAEVWDALFEAGRAEEIEPIGLGARDTLRMEMKYALYGNDIDQTTNPLEAGLGFVVKLDKPEGFVGDNALRRVNEERPRRRLVCLEMDGAGIPRPHHEIYAGAEKVGAVTSGTMSPSLNKGIALAYVARRHAKADSALEMDIRGRRLPATVVRPPFYKQGSRK